jgi:phage terminase large subunit
MSRFSLPTIPRSNMPLTETEEMEYLALLEQSEVEQIAPKFELARQSGKPIIIGQGGRGAGAKSWSVANWIVQLCQYGSHRVACLREVQLTLTESVYQLMVDTIHRLGYSSSWTITNDRLTNNNTGSFIIFKGLRDLRAARNVKGLEGFDIVWCDEAATIIDDSWSMLMPTLVRNDGWMLFITYNPETDFDPCTTRFWNSDRQDAYRIRLEPGRIDNPWWNDGLENEMRELYKTNPDEAEHVYGGQPRKQGQNAVMSRVSIRAAMSRCVEPVGAIELGVDVARYGDDKTDIYKRKGLKVIGHKELVGFETIGVANAVWDMADQNPSYLIKVDSGYNPGVIDVLRGKGAKVSEVAFGSSAMNTDKYDTAADEMWFTFPIDEAEIPNDPDLMQQLAGRLYGYDRHGRRKVESKDKYKERFQKSPDKADGLLLCFYRGGRMIVDSKSRNEMAARRARGK